MGMIFKGLTFGGVNSLDYGIFITGEAVYNAPERSVTSIEIEGRNGDLLIDNGRFLNIEIKYPAGCFAETQEDFKQKIESFRNAIISQISYQRLTDDYNPDEYRLAVYKSGLDVSVAVLHQGGEFTLTFDCKPQRFLTSGETERSIPEWSDMHTDSGSLVTVDNSIGDYAVKSLSTAIVPQQDLNGYDNPWAGGAGKNKLKNTATSTTINNVVFTVNADGSVTANGLASANAQLNLTIDTSNVYGDLYFNCAYNGSGTTYDSYMWDNTASARCKKWNGTTNSSNGYKNLEEIKIVQGHTTTLVIRVYSGYNANNVKFYPMICSSTETETTFAPYENICPITGFSSTNVTRAGKNLLPPYSTSGGTSTSNGITFTYNSNGSITASGTATANASSESPSGFRLPPGTYKKNAYDSTNKVGLLVLKKVTSSILVTVGLSTSDTFTLTEEDAQYELVVRMRVESGATLNSYNYTPIIRLPDTTDASELYNGNTYSVSFGSAGTVYGGTLDVVSGQLTVTHAMLTLNTAAMNNSESYPGWKASGVRSLIGAGINQNYQNVMLNVGTSYSINTNSSNDIFILPKTEYNNMSQSDWIALAIDVQAIIPLATPLTYQLTATQVAFLLGTNNIWSNTGDIQIEYGKGGNTLFNPTLFDSRPLIELTGAGTLGINNYIITITGSGKLYIDCDTMEAYTITGGIVTSANNRVSLNTTDYPVLRSGINSFAVGTGISNVKITPRWWRV